MNRQVENVDDSLEALDEEPFKRQLKGYYGELLKGAGLDVRGEDLAARVNDAAGYLVSTATVYRLNREDELLVPKVSDILRELDDLARLPVERWSRRMSTLGMPVLEAMLGGFPFAQVAYAPVGFDESGEGIIPLSGSRSVFVPAGDRMQRQDVKHIMSDSPTGLVKPSVLPSFIDMVCLECDADALAGMISEVLGLLFELPNRDVLLRHLSRQWAPVATDIFARLIPAKFAVLVNEMEDDIDRAPGILLRFLGKEASLLFTALPVEPGIANDLVARSIETVLKAGNLADRRTGLLRLAQRNPAAFRQALATLVGRTELQYGKDVNPTGMGRRTTRPYAAPAVWVLIQEVLDHIWPAANGALTKSTSAWVCAIAELTYQRGELEFVTFGSSQALSDAACNTGIGNRGGGAERMFNYEMVKLAVSYRNARHQLNGTLEFLERAIREVRRQLGVNHSESLRQEATIRVLHRWREEMDWRLLHGAYEKEQWRKSSMTVPRFPQMKASLPIEDRVRKIVAAAQSLIDEMLMSISREPTRNAGAAMIGDVADSDVTNPATPDLENAILKSPPQFPE
ncbi:hypothetical protein [Mesorhizobium sp. KR1-2]|uniref:hypothetical protein n=1 Tax=Mesorhizobium sp. KR1-2 TaxID=3156609 RepID=UPI0032B43C4B